MARHVRIVHTLASCILCLYLIEYDAWSNVWDEIRNTEALFYSWFHALYKISDVIHYIFWILKPWLLRKLYALCVTGCLLNFVILEFCYIRRAESINLINFDSSEVQPLCELNQGHHESTVRRFLLSCFEIKLYIQVIFMNTFVYPYLSTQARTPVYSKLAVLTCLLEDFQYLILEFWFIQLFIWMWNNLATFTFIIYLFLFTLKPALEQPKSGTAKHWFNSSANQKCNPPG